MKKNYIFLFVMAVLLLTGVHTKANETSEIKIQNLKQTTATEDSVSITWEGENTPDYMIYVKKTTDRKYRVVGKTNQTSFTVSGLDAATTYSILVNGYSADGNWYFGAVKRVKTLPDKQTDNIFFSMNDYTRLNIWSEDENQNICTVWDGFEVVLEDYNHKVIFQDICKKRNSGSVSVLIEKAFGQSCTIKVRGYITIGGESYYSGWIQKKFASQPYIKNITKVGKKLKIDWARVKGASSYDVYVSTRSNMGFQKVKSVGKNTFSASLTRTGNKKITSRTYYVYVIAKAEDGKEVIISEPDWVWDSKSKRRMTMSPVMGEQYVW